MANLLLVSGSVPVQFSCCFSYTHIIWLSWLLKSQGLSSSLCSGWISWDSFWWCYDDPLLIFHMTYIHCAKDHAAYHRSLLFHLAIIIPFVKILVCMALFWYKVPVLMVWWCAELYLVCWVISLIWLWCLWRLNIHQFMQFWFLTHKTGADGLGTQ